MAYTMKVRGGLTKPPAVLMCPRLRGQKTEEIVCITDYETGKKQKGLKDVCWNRAAKNEQSNSPIGSLSVQLSCLAGVVMSAVYLVCFRRQMDQWRTNRPQGALPGVRYAIFSPSSCFASAALGFPQIPLINREEEEKKKNNSQAWHFPIILAGEEQTATNDNSLVRKCAFRYGGGPS